MCVDFILSFSLKILSPTFRNTIFRAHHIYWVGKNCSSVVHLSALVVNIFFFTPSSFLLFIQILLVFLFGVFDFCFYLEAAEETRHRGGMCLYAIDPRKSFHIRVVFFSGKYGSMGEKSAFFFLSGPESVSSCESHISESLLYRMFVYTGTSIFAYRWRKKVSRRYYLCWK